MNKLPDKPSELIMLALKDLVCIRNTPGYIVDMEYWHRSQGDTCSVCLAGAVIAGTLKSPKQTTLPCDFDDDIRNKLLALNKFRLGHLYRAFRYLGLPFPSNYSRRIPITAYEDDPEQFLMEMKGLANALAAGGY